MARKRGTAMYSLMAAKVLFAKEASAAVADVTLSRWGGHLLEGYWCLPPPIRRWTLSRRRYGARCGMRWALPGDLVSQACCLTDPLNAAERVNEARLGQKPIQILPLILFRVLDSMYVCRTWIEREISDVALAASPLQTPRPFPLPPEPRSGRCDPAK